jgi:hypothetical protein
VFLITTRWFVPNSDTLLKYKVTDFSFNITIFKITYCFSIFIETGIFILNNDHYLNKNFVSFYVMILVHSLKLIFVTKINEI